MKILKILSAKLSAIIKFSSRPKIPRWLIGILFVGGLAGFIDSFYLTLEHYNGTAVRCFILKGCNKVLASSFSEIMGLPVALFGAAYYLLIFILIIAYIDTEKKILLNIISRLTVAGFIMSSWFLFVQLFIIKAVCTYCLFSAFISIILFILGLMIIKITDADSHWQKLKNTFKKIKKFIL